MRSCVFGPNFDISSGGYLGHLKLFFWCNQRYRWLPPYGYLRFFMSKTNLENHHFHFPNPDPIFEGVCSTRSKRRNRCRHKVEALYLYKYIVSLNSIGISGESTFFVKYTTFVVCTNFFFTKNFLTKSLLTIDYP